MKSRKSPEILRTFIFFRCRSKEISEMLENPGNPDKCRNFLRNPENSEIKNHNFSGNCAAGSAIAPIYPQINASALRLLVRGE